MSALPLVSVAMPIYNTERYLAEAIQSILNQTFADFELVALNDGSVDNSIAILEEYACRDSRIRVISRPNTGLVGARNDCLAAARGRYVAWADSDDVSLPDRLEKQVAYLEGHPDIAVLGGAMQAMSSTGGVLPQITRNPTSPQEVYEQLPTRCSIGQGTVMMRIEVAREVGGYRSLFRGAAEDYDLWLRTTEKYSLANLADVLVLVRHHASSTTTKDPFSMFLGGIVAQRAAEYRRRHPSDTDPCDGQTDFSPNLLAALGIGQAEIEWWQGASYSNMMFTMLGVGEIQAVMNLLKQYEAADISPWVRNKLAPIFAFLRARIFLRQHRPIAAAGQFLRALTGNPKFVVGRYCTDSFRRRFCKLAKSLKKDVVGIINE